MQSYPPCVFDEHLTDAQVSATVRDEGMKLASDGLESDAHGRGYATGYEIARRGTDGRYETLVRDPRALWPDTMAIAGDGSLYFIATQLHRQPDYHDGNDVRAKLYSLFRLKSDARQSSWWKREEGYGLLGARRAQAGDVPLVILRGPFNGNDD